MSNENKPKSIYMKTINTNRHLYDDPYLKLETKDIMVFSCDDIEIHDNNLALSLIGTIDFEKADELEFRIGKGIYRYKKVI